MSWILQITSGVGPWEVRRFVALLATALEAILEQRGAVIVSVSFMGDAEAPSSVELMLEGLPPLEDLLGTHALVARSERRHKASRKRWFAGVGLLQAATVPAVEVAEDSVEFQATRAGGPGGQSVNTTSSAVRALHRPSGISVRVVTERSQLANRRIALERLRQLLGQRAQQTLDRAQQSRRLEHHRLERGCPVMSWSVKGAWEELEARSSQADTRKETRISTSAISPRAGGVGDAK